MHFFSRQFLNCFDISKRLLCWAIIIIKILIWSFLRQLFWKKSIYKVSGKYVHKVRLRSFIDRSIDSWINSSIHSVIDWLIDLSMYSFIYAFIDSVIHLLIDSFIHLFMFVCMFIYLVNHPSICSFIFLFIFVCSFINASIYCLVNIQ